ncbi:SDR family NAD(P)-dependent oxidoreductase [Thermanaeromonas sp. C210]|uniref:SDR family NAD(P)-dependent oxidoreductase n=1 Tax=Thermanaeromonas sp. C210 TaxID=2731925 RepID=UPI00155D5255|nr:SDR family oxidoreductase [Thermanaeromonas sp. C210]GFN22359.1 oxidoreductase [Thermanaeromonas sp. C210]
MRLKNKVAVVTGGSSGIGRAIAIKFAEEGAKVAIFDVQRESRLESEKPCTVEAIETMGGEALYVKTDVSRTEEVERAVDQVLSEYQRIDILVNSAGIFIRDPITEVSDDEWDQVIRVNLYGCFYMCRTVIPHMVKSGYGKIVNIASIHGLLGTGNATAYCASKGALINLTRQLAVDYAKKGIRVNTIAPGTIVTAMSKPFRETPEIMKEYLTRTLLPRLGTPEDVAYAALYLASSESDWVTGHCLVVDGGWTAW